MGGLISAISINVGFKLAVCLVLFINYFESDQKFIFYWALAWLTYFLSTVFELILITDLLNLSSPTITLLFFLRYALFALTGVIFFKSILLMKNIRAKAHILILALLAIFSPFWGTFVIAEWFWAVLPATFICGFSLILCAFCFRKLKSQGLALGNQLIFYGFLLIGLHMLDYPFLRTIESFAPWGFSLISLFTLVFAVGLVMRSSFQVKNQRLHAVESARELTALHSITSIVSQDFNLDKLFREILNKMSKILNMKAGIIYLLDEEKKLLINRAHLNIPSALKDKLTKPIKLGEGWTGKVAQNGQMQIIRDVSASTEVWPETKKVGLKTLVTFPIKLKEKIIGVIEFGDYSPRTFNQQEIKLLSSMANEAAIAIQNAKLYASAKKNSQELSVLHDISITMINYLDMDKMLNKVLEKVVRVLNIEAGGIFIINHKHDSFILRAHTGLSKGFIEDISSMPLGSGTLTAQIAKTNKPLWVEDLSIYPTIKQESVKKENLGGYCGVPIDSTGGKIVGVLIVTSHKLRKFTDDELRLLISIANEMGAAIESSKLYEDLQDVYLRTVTALAEVVDAKDHYTYSHSKYVTTYAVKIAKEMGFSDKEIEEIRKACQLHDIGKISISDYILTKKKKLNNNEWEEIKKHPQKGADILAPLTFLKEPGGGVIEFIKQHHERYDGKGYPAGLKGEKIKLGARIMAVADSYHAMISSRPYRKALSQKKVIKELERCSGTQFDPTVVKAFLAVLAKEQKYIEPKA